jgi:hypothetical protein
LLPLFGFPVALPLFETLAPNTLTPIIANIKSLFIVERAMKNVLIFFPFYFRKKKKFFSEKIFLNGNVTSITTELFFYIDHIIFILSST